MSKPRKHEEPAPTPPAPPPACERCASENVEIVHGVKKCRACGFESQAR